MRASLPPDLLTADGYVNATRLCGMFDKSGTSWAEWRARSSTGELLVKVCVYAGGGGVGALHLYHLHAEGREPVRVNAARDTTALHPAAALSLAASMSPEALRFVHALLTHVTHEGAASADECSRRRHELVLADYTLSIAKAETALVQARNEPRLRELQLEITRASRLATQALTEQRLYAALIRHMQPNTPLYQRLCERFLADNDAKQSALATLFGVRPLPSYPADAADDDAPVPPACKRRATTSPASWPDKTVHSCFSRH